MMTTNTSDFSGLANKNFFTAIDYAMFVTLIVASMMIGIVVGVKGFNQTTTKDFFVGGRNMHPIPVSLSLIGGVISALSVLGNPTEIYLYGTQLWLNLLGCCWGVLVVIFILLPVLYPLNLISLMQYLELRYHSNALKKMGSLTQLINSSIFLGISLYTPALALSSVTPLPMWMSVVVLGLVCSVYISIGGVKAVVYTDVLQTLIMLIGTLAIIIQISLDYGGLPNIFHIAEQGGRLEFFNFDPSPFVRHTFWSVQVLGLYFVVSVVGISQAQFQRLSSVRTLRISQWLCAAFLVGLIILWSLFNISGLAAYAAYAHCDPLESKKIEKADQIIPFLVADKLSRIPGMTGIFIAAVYGAVLSSVSSQANAIAALVWEDFMSNWNWFTVHVKFSSTNVTRVICTVAGLLGIILAFLMRYLGTLFQASYSIAGALISPMDGLFVTGITAPWVNKQGAICGFLTALFINIWYLSGMLLGYKEKAKPLPLSTEGCISSTAYETYLTTNNSLFNSYEVQFSTELPDTFHNEAESVDHTIYNISYCYTGTIGVLTVFIVSSIVSILTGPYNPNDIDEALIFKPSMRVYRWIWHKTHPSEENNVELKSSTQKQEGHL